MLDIQDLEGNVLHQCRKDMDVIVSYHQFPKTQTTQNSKRKQKTQKLTSTLSSLL
jgi:3-dehydroquinate dehydratase